MSPELSERLARSAPRLGLAALVAGLLLTPRTANASVTITAPAAVTAGSGGLVASVPQQAGVSFQWGISGATGGAITAGAGTSAINFTAGTTGITPAQAGSLTLTVAVVDASGGSSVAAVTVPVYAPADATITAPAAVTAAGASQPASVPSQAGAHYSWSITNGSFDSSGSGNAAARFSGGLSGAVSLSATVTNGAGQTATAAVSVPIDPMPNPTITAPTTVTAGAVGLTASVQVQPGDTYAWSITGGTITSDWRQPQITFTVGSGGWLVLNCTVTNGAGTYLTSSTLLEAPPPDSTLSLSPGVVTSGQSVNVQVAAQGYSTYLWSVSGSGASATFSGQGNNTITLVPTVTGSSGTVTVTCTVTNGLGATSTSSRDIAVYSAGALAIAAPTAITQGLTYTASVPAPTGAAVAWAVYGGTIISGATSSTVSFTAPQGNATSTLTLSVSVTSSSSAVGGSVQLTAYPAPMAALVGPRAVTAGKVGYTLYYKFARRPVPGLQVSCLATGGLINSSTASTVVFTPFIDRVTSMTFNCTITNGAGTSIAQQLVIPVWPPPSWVPISAPDAAGAGIPFTVSVPAGSGALLFCWDAGNAAGYANVTAGGSAQTVTAYLLPGNASAALTLTCQVTNGAGDTATSSVGFALYSLPLPVISAGSSLSSFACGYGASATAPPGVGFVWDVSGGTLIGGQGTPVISFCTAGSGSLVLSLRVTNASGAFSNATLQLPVIQAATQPAINFAGSNVTSGVGTFSASVPGQPWATYAWSISNGTFLSAMGAPLASSSGSSIPDPSNPGGQMNQVNFQATGAPGTFLMLTVSASQGGATVGTPAQLMIPIVAPPARTPLLSAPPAVAFGGDGQASVVARPYETYLWTISGGVITSLGGSAGSLDGNGNNRITFRALSAGAPVSLSCQEMDPAGRLSAAVTVTIPVTCPGGTRACGSVCQTCCSAADCPSAANATASCNGGVCSFTCSSSAFKQCPGAGGSCVPTGGCCSGADCPAALGASATCNSGLCGLSCDPHND